MKLSLVVMTAGKAQGQVIPVNLAQFVIGRDPQCNLRPASALISKRHCAVLLKDGEVYVRDFDSTNGTFVNEEAVKGEMPLKNDDVLKVGPLAFKVQAFALANVPSDFGDTGDATCLIFNRVERQRDINQRSVLMFPDGFEIVDAFVTTDSIDDYRFLWQPI